MTTPMNHLTSLLERRNQAETAYRIANGSMDSSPLQVIIAKQELKAARFEWLAACEEYTLENHLFYEDEENV